MSNVAEEDWSFALCDHLNKLLLRMLKGCNVAKTCGDGHIKVSCLVQHELGPVLR